MRMMITIIGITLLSAFASANAADGKLLTCRADQVKTFVAYSVAGKPTPRNIFLCMASDLYATEAGIKSVQSILTEREGKSVVITFFSRVD